MPTRVALGLLFAGLLALAGGCITTDVGNASKTCREGDRCVCDGIGNCDVSCPGGGCDVRCSGTGNRFLACGGGSSTLECGGTGNCIVEQCSGGCVQLCEGIGKCICAQRRSGACIVEGEA